jgi:UDP-glucose 4-epimerase
LRQFAIGKRRYKVATMTVLVTGGAGYIGSVTVEQLRRSGNDVVVLDDLSRGHRDAVDAGIPFYCGKVGDSELIRRIVEEHKVESCVHFAAFTYVGESVVDPAKYFENNTIQTNSLLNSLISKSVKRIVFSSTAATYGEPHTVPIDEDHLQRPVNPYGWSKFMTERILESYDAAYGLSFVSLRYFNAAGAARDLGEDHDPETHLIPNVLKAAAGELPFVSVFGNDYPTPDGTCIRDYIHVSDLADAHVRALAHLSGGCTSTCVNLGNGLGFSVLEVIDAAREVTGRPIEVKFEPRRAGDPPRLIADSSKAREVLGWEPRFTGLDPIVRSAWEWKAKFPKGYSGRQG